MAKVSSAGKKGPSFGLYMGHDEAWIITLAEKDDYLDSIKSSPEDDLLKLLDVSVLQNLIFENVMDITREQVAAKKDVTFTIDPVEVKRRVDSTEAVCGFLMNPTDIGQVIEVATSGGVMPQKSTYFYPKADLRPGDESPSLDESKSGPFSSHRRRRMTSIHRPTCRRWLLRGRSNVGKSSLINSLTGRKGLVKVSKTPGKTQLLNFFSINEKLPSSSICPVTGLRGRLSPRKKKWGKMVETYIKKRESLRGVIVLLDCRRKPNEDDRALLEWLVHYDTPFILVVTKIDKVPKTHRHREIKKVMEVVGDLAGEDIKPLVYSSQTGEGKKNFGPLSGR